jgi:hypothetical protein
MKKLILILSFVFTLGLFSVEAMTSEKLVSNMPVKTEQTVQKAVDKPAAKPTTKKKSKKIKSTKKAPAAPVKK